MPNSIPAIALGGSASGGGGASETNGLPVSIAEDYAQLIADGSVYFDASGAKIFNMDAGAISTAFSGQVGRVVQGVTITADMVAQNQRLLDAIGSYCRANGISIHVEAQLSNTPQEDWTYQWLGAAVQAGLPITAIENDNEVEASIPDTGANYANIARDMAAIVAQVAQYYPSVQVGQWVGQEPLSATADWWAAYDTAAGAAGLPTLSYAVADTSWNAPWVNSPTSWQGWLRGLSNLVQANSMQLEIALEAIGTDATDQQWTAQSEQHAAMLAQLQGVAVSTLLVRTWTSALPDAVLPINAPTTLGNDAAEIAATYPLYQAGLITAQLSASLTAASQRVVTVGQASSVGTVALNLGAADIAAGARAAIVLIDQTGTLSATPAYNGTVSGVGTNTLVLSGTAAELAAELQTLRVNEGATGPDTIDVEAFGANGRLADMQIPVLALPVGSFQNSGVYSFQPQTPAQGWIGATATLGSSGLITAETFTWNSTDQDPGTGQYRLIKTDSVHEPLANLGVSLIGGIAKQKSADPSTGGSALPLGMSYFNPSAFDPAQTVSTINVLSTEYQYGSNGRLQSITDTLAPTTPTATVMDGSLPNYFATGGTQVTQFNTGNNPGWQSDWSSAFSSVKTTYGSNHQLLEQIFQGGSSEPWLVIDNVFNPYTGALWEQFQTSLPPAQFSTFATGNQYVTEFNTGDNPDWDSTDWGSAPQVTVTWQDYYAAAVTKSSPAPTGLQITAPGFLAPGASLSPIRPLPVTGAIGNGYNFGYAGGHDVFVLSSAGQLGFYEVSPAGEQLAGNTALTYQGGPATIFPDQVIIGTGFNFGLQGGHDVFLQSKDSRISFLEMTASGAVVSGNWEMTYQGGPATIYPDQAVIGSGFDFGRQGGHDVFFLSQGRLSYLEFNSAGAVVAGNWKLTYQGGPATVPADVEVLGTGFDFGGQQGSDIFFVSPSGQLAYLEFNSAGTVVSGNWNLTYQAGPATVAANEEVLGTGFNFGQQGGSDVFFISPRGQLAYLEFNAAGAVVSGNWNLTYQGGPATINPNEEVLGTGFNFGQQGGSDVFFVSPSKQLGYLEFNSAGTVVSGSWYMTLPDGPALVTGDASVIGTAHDLAGAGGSDIFLLSNSETVSYAEFSPSGSGLTPFMTFINASGAQQYVSTDTQVIGSGNNLLQSGEKDLFLREAGGQIHLWEVTQNAVVSADIGLFLPGGSRAIVGPGNTITAAGQNILGFGGHDISVHTPAGSAAIYEFNSAGTVLRIVWS